MSHHLAVKLLSTYSKIVQTYASLGELQANQMTRLMDRTHEVVMQRADQNMWKGWVTLGIGVTGSVIGMGGEFTQWAHVTKVVSQFLPQIAQPVQSRLESNMMPLQTEETINTQTRLPGASEKQRSSTDTRKDWEQRVSQILQAHHESMKKAAMKN